MITTTTLTDAGQYDFVLKGVLNNIENTPGYTNFKVFLIDIITSTTPA
jgi:hypothetical protein